MRCLNCDTEFRPKTKRAKFDTDRCRLQYYRNNPETQNTSTVSDETQTSRNETISPKTPSSVSLTPADKLFDGAAPGYYVFGPKVYERDCLICAKRFKTRLQLLKTCSPEHYLEVVDRLSGKYAKKTGVPGIAA